MATKLYVGNLSFDVTENELEELFAEAGTVESVAVIVDKFSGQSRGFGFVEMSSSAEAADAIQRFDGHELKGRTLRVNEARPRPDRPRGDRPGGKGSPRGGRFGGQKGRW